MAGVLYRHCGNNLIQTPPLAQVFYNRDEQ